MSNKNIILTYFKYFLGYPQLCLTSTRSSKDTNIRNIYIKGICIKKSYVIGVFVNISIELFGIG